MRGIFGLGREKEGTRDAERGNGRRIRWLGTVEGVLHAAVELACERLDGLVDRGDFLPERHFALADGRRDALVGVVVLDHGEGERGAAGRHVLLGRVRPGADQSGFLGRRCDERATRACRHKTPSAPQHARRHPHRMADSGQLGGARDRKQINN